MKTKKRKLTTSTTPPSLCPPQPPLPLPTTISSLLDDVVTDILLCLSSTASIACALFASQHWWWVASSPTFVRCLCALHAYQLLLGHFASQDNFSLPLLHPAPLHPNPVLAARVHRGDFFLTRLQDFDRCALEDIRDGLLLFSIGAGAEAGEARHGSEAAEEEGRRNQDSVAAEEEQGRRRKSSGRAGKWRARWGRE